ncbi:MAG: hypothetical protein KF891_02780 [Rhizobacter sp.]|nr:hypothetical protein [Rhizobacter sp.]
MDLDHVPQEGNATLGGHRKAVYARDASGRMVIAASTGWEAEEIVTTHAVESLHAQAEAARERVKAGSASPLEYWMYERRMDVPLLSQTSGFWQWRVKRHLRPEVFATLDEKHLQRYADALGVSTAELHTLPP